MERKHSARFGRCECMSTSMFSLLDYLAYKMGCAYLSDLKFLKGWQITRLYTEIEKIQAEAFSSKEWNDALEYLTGMTSAEKTAKKSRECLLLFLKEES